MFFLINQYFFDRSKINCVYIIAHQFNTIIYKIDFFPRKNLT